MCWNCRGVFSCIPFLAESLRMYNVNVCALSEHWLRTFQLHVLDSIDKNYISIAKGTDEFNPELLTCKGRSGVALLISKDIYPFTSLIEVNSDRIIGIEINIPNSEKYYVFSLYLPAVTQPYEYFRNEVDLLFELSSVYEEFGSVILMGDFNSKIGGPRCKIKYDERSKLCKTLMSTHNLCSVNMELMCKGPVNTFQSYEDGPSTCIDHILINRTKLQHVKQAKVIDNHSFSTSDHHPIVCTLETESHLHHPQETSDPTVSWERARSTNSIEDYTFAVSTNLWTVNFPTTATPDVIESYYSCIVSAIKKAEKDTLPYKKFNRHSKPYWNPNLTVLRDSMRSIRNEWINNCHCHDTNCEFFQKYKSAKREFRTALRKAFDEYESNLAKTIESNLDIDQKTVWTIINNRKKKSSACSALVKDGVTYTDPKKINDIWLSHFQNVFSPSTYTDPKRETEITEKVSSIRKIVNRDQNNITFKLSDVSEICSKLKNNKACGHDGLFYEHIRYGGKLLIKHLHHLFNLCIKCAYIPNDWRKSMIILLYKGGNKPKTDTNSYRGISLVPSITKIFEKMVDLLLTLLRTDFPNVQQVAYQKLLSSLNASFNLNEVTFHHIKKNGTVIVVLLDSTKAFDTVPPDGLRIKLFEYGATGKLWLLLDNMYTDLSSAILFGGKLSKWFKLNRGVRQGSALSAKLYLIFINDLINELESSNKGAFLYDINSSSPVQADDISLIATNHESAQKMVSICEQYSESWSFSFSPTKSKLLQFGKKLTGPDIFLYNEPILSVKSATHVGISLDTSMKTMDRTLKACRTLRATTASEIRSGIHPAVLNSIVSAKIIRQVCYPKALYGCEIWGKLSKTETLMLERTHHYVCKFIQGLPRRTRTDMCLSLIGWLNLDSFINERKLLFFGRICNLPQRAISFRILVRKLFELKYFNQEYTNCASDFSKDCVDILYKYHLSDYLTKFMDSGHFPSQRIWKRIVHRSIFEYELKEWQQRINIDSDFNIFKKIHKVFQPHPAWTVALDFPYLRKQANYIVSLCCLVHNTNSDSILCDKCGKLFTDPCIHAISSCDYLSDIRDEFWCELLCLNPITFSAFLGSLDDEDFCYILLSCETEFELDCEQKKRFQFLCVKYVYRFCKTFSHS
ncbi:unnamed protein product [Mytilus edulis]|uniref:Reverse transcriptase domain-containing protein n=1 Tax=Mytilus edulis TaxID=6550 RepID=A0A8S3TWU9_MYTED|nr:unnamed protein product [Mytilus edulis]